jgi:hypothetical protein
MEEGHGEMGEVVSAVMGAGAPQEEEVGCASPNGKVEGDGKEVEEVLDDAIASISPEIKQHISDMAASVPQQQSMEHIVSANPPQRNNNNKDKNSDKSFVQTPLCYPFGMPNVEEQMLVVNPEDDASLYQDAVVCALCFFHVIFDFPSEIARLFSRSFSHYPSRYTPFLSFIYSLIVCPHIN